MIKGYKVILKESLSEISENELLKYAIKNPADGSEVASIIASIGNKDSINPFYKLLEKYCYQVLYVALWYEKEEFIEMLLKTFSYDINGVQFHSLFNEESLDIAIFERKEVLIKFLITNLGVSMSDVFRNAFTKGIRYIPVKAIISAYDNNQLPNMDICAKLFIRYNYLIGDELLRRGYNVKDNENKIIEEIEKLVKNSSFWTYENSISLTKVLLTYNFNLSNIKDKQALIRKAFNFPKFGMKEIDPSALQLHKDGYEEITWINSKLWLNLKDDGISEEDLVNLVKEYNYFGSSRRWSSEIFEIELCLLRLRENDKFFQVEAYDRVYMKAYRTKIIEKMVKSYGKYTYLKYAKIEYQKSLRKNCFNFDIRAAIFYAVENSLIDKFLNVHDQKVNLNLS